MQRVVHPVADSSIARPFALVLAFAFLVLLPTKLLAGQYHLAPDETIVDEASLIVFGNVTGVAARPAPHPRTAVHLDVRRVLKGSHPGASVTLTLPGGISSTTGLESQMVGLAVPKAGQQWLVFLRKGPDGDWRTVHLGLGMFVLLDNEQLVRTVEGSVTEVASRFLSARRGNDPRNLETFLAWIHDRQRGVNRSPDYFEAELLRPVPKFNVLTDGELPFRWQRFDRRRAVEWHVARKQKGIKKGGQNELLEALAAWSNQGIVNLEFEGRRNSTTGGGQRSDSRNTVLFNAGPDQVDQYDCDTGSGSLGSTFVWFVPGSSHTRFGKAYRTILEADVVLPQSFRCVLDQSADPETFLAEFIGNRLGVALGLATSCGGTSGVECTAFAQKQSLMRAPLHDDNRGALVTADDRAGLFSAAGLRYTASRNVTPVGYSPADIQLNLDVAEQQVCITNKSKAPLDIARWVVSRGSGPQKFTFSRTAWLRPGTTTCLTAGSDAVHSPPDFIKAWNNEVWLSGGDSAELRDAGRNTVVEDSDDGDGGAVPGVPPSIAVNVNGSSATVSWPAAAGGGAATSYLVQVGRSSGASDFATREVTSRSTTFTSIPNGTYYARVRGKNPIGTGAPTADRMFVINDGGGVPNMSMTITMTATPEIATIRNNSGNAVDMTGWRLVSVVGPQTFNFPNGHTVPAGGRVRVTSGTGAFSGGDALKWGGSFIWLNSGDEGRLLDDQGRLVARVVGP